MRRRIHGSTLTLATVLAGLCPAATGMQQARPSTPGGVPAEIHLQGLGGPGTQPFTAGTTCLASLEDQAGGGCLKACSIPTAGLLFPYPGIDNTFGGAAFVGGGRNNQATGPHATVTGGRDNLATGYYTTVGGGLDNEASGATDIIGGGSFNQATGGGATVGGGNFNYATGFRSTIAGGGNNRAFGFKSTIGGGEQNSASARYSAVLGGWSNDASGGYASVGGGWDNDADAYYATVGGGKNNTASGRSSTVAGGAANLAYGNLSATVGGGVNAAMGDFSLAAGRRAKADHDGSFVWGDSQVVDKTSSAADEFNVYCSGGARFFTNSAATTGVLIAPGGGSWSSVSDRASKENLLPVQPRAVLEGVVSLSLSTWNYRDQDDSIRHMGPMAQDFRAAFGLGVSDELIDTVDPDGVALAAIQGLHALVREQEAEIETLRERLGRLEARQN